MSEVENYIEEAPPKDRFLSYPPPQQKNLSREYGLKCSDSSEMQSIKALNEILNNAKY